MPIELRQSHSLCNAVKLVDVVELMQTETRGERTNLARLLIRVYEQLPKLANDISGKFLVHAGTQRYFASAKKDSRP
jgi:hypothetical protein